MKKFTLLVAFIVSAVFAQAQLPNPGFEIVGQYNWPSFWRPTSIVVLPIDTTCTWLGQDSIFFSNPNAHTGNHAMELGVASYCGNTYGYNIQSAMYDIDTFADQRIPFTQRPASFTFYYKFFPVMNDAMRVHIELENDNTGTVAEAVIQWQQAPSPGWQMATIPLTYQSSDTPTHLTINFSLTSDSVLHHGTRIIIDDINYIGTSGVDGVEAKNEQLKCYPVPAKDILYVSCGNKFVHDVARLTITNASGIVVTDDVAQLADQTIQLNVANLPAGLYNIRVSAGKQSLAGRFIK